MKKKEPELTEKEKKIIDKFIKKLLKEYRGFFEMCAKESVKSIEMTVDKDFKGF